MTDQGPELTREVPHAVRAVDAALAVADGQVTTVILVEGTSDRVALEALALRDGRDLGAEGVVVIPMGGATNVRHFVEYLGPRGLGMTLAGMGDVAQEDYFRRGLERAGYGRDLTRQDIRTLGFNFCVEDLEDELIQALGVARVEDIVAAEGELESFRRLQRQPAQRDRTTEQQLHRFFSGRSGHKARYARLLVNALEPSETPLPLRRTLAQV